MSRLNLVNAAVLAAMLAGCAQLGPFVDRRRNAGAKTEAALYVGRSKPGNPAICYNSLITPYSEVKKLADEDCRKEGKGSRAEPVRQSVFTCRVLVPNHYYFKCVK